MVLQVTRHLGGDESVRELEGDCEYQERELSIQGVMAGLGLGASFGEEQIASTVNEEWLRIDIG